MSLINDALKRVKEAQHKAPPSASLGPQLRPVEPVAVPTPHSLGWLLPFALTGVALLALLLLWEFARKQNPVVVRAQPPAQEQPSAVNDGSQSPAPPAEPAPPASSSAHLTSATANEARATVVPSLASSNAPTIALASSTLGPQIKGAPVADTPGSTNSGAVQSADEAGTSGNTNLTVEVPKPPPLKLQGIVFSKRPSAVINGRTLFVGDRIREFRVAAITQDAAILVGGGRTNTLSLSE